MTFSKDQLLNSKPTIITTHIVAWLMFLIFPYLFMLFDIKMFTWEFAAKTLINTLFFVIFFYTNTLVLIPRLIGKKKILLYILSILLFIALLTAEELIMNNLFRTHGWMEGHGHHPHRMGFGIMSLHIFGIPFPFVMMTLSKTFSNVLLLTFVGGFLRITQEWQKSEKQKKEIENEKLTSELAFLKSQINPHFLFNVLNNIYSLAHKKSDDTETAVLKLSQLMRYMIYESNYGLVSIDKEIECLENYIDLQKMRLSKNAQISFKITGQSKGKMIEPMLLVPFVENAFKHGISYVDKMMVDISLTLEDDFLLFTVENYVADKSKAEEVYADKANGIGLQNIKRRLDLLYPDKHILSISSKEGKFSVSLKIQLAHD
ncbi:MAG: histidine kinase [Bacteroidota bacterium]|nr:histidine kinase [Bacteroidota bacterium]